MRRTGIIAVLCVVVLGAGWWAFGRSRQTRFGTRAGERILYSRDFDKPGFWDRIALDPSMSVSNGRLILQSKSRMPVEYASGRGGYGRFFKYVTLEVKASSDNWAHDTSIAMEEWRGSSHHGIVFKDGCFMVINELLPGPNNTHVERVRNWDGLKDRENVFRIVWRQGCARLYINDELCAAYYGSLVPDQPLLFRLNASGEYGDRLAVDYILVTKGPE